MSYLLVVRISGGYAHTKVDALFLLQIPTLISVDVKQATKLGFDSYLRVFVKISLSMNRIILACLLLTQILLVSCELNENNKKLSWIVGKWRSEFSGKIVWPTVPSKS